MKKTLGGIPVATYRDSRIEAVTLSTGVVQLRGEQDQPVEGVKQTELRDFLDWYPDADRWDSERFRKKLFSHVWVERVHFSLDEVVAWTDHNQGDLRRTDDLIGMSRWIADQRAARALRELVRTQPRAILDAAAQRRSRVRNSRVGNFRLTRAEMELLDHCAWLRGSSSDAGPSPKPRGRNRWEARGRRRPT